MASALLDCLELAPVPQRPWNDEVGESIADAFAPLTLGEAVARLENRGIWCERVNAAGHRILDDDRDAPGLISTVEHPVFGAMRQIGGLVRMDGKRATATRNVPLLGQHSREILQEVGYAEAEIDDFYARGIVV